MEPPEDLIPQEKMVAILHDLALINAAKNSNPSVLENNNIEPMRYIYSKYGIDSLQFVSSDVYYASIPLVYEAIYRKVSTQLESEKKKIQDALKQNNDSVRKATVKQYDRGTNPEIRRTAQDTLP